MPEQGRYRTAINSCLGRHERQTRRREAEVERKLGWRCADIQLYTELPQLIQLTPKSGVQWPSSFAFLLQLLDAIPLPIALVEELAPSRREHGYPLGLRHSNDLGTTSA